MKTIILVAVVVCSVLSREVPPQEQQGTFTEEQRQLFSECLKQTGVSIQMAIALKEQAMDAQLSEPQARLVCCLTDKLFTDGKLNTGALQTMVDGHKAYFNHANTTIDVTSILDSCQEKTGLRATNLGGCPDQAKLSQCFVHTLRSLSQNSN